MKRLVPFALGFALALGCASASASAHEWYPRLCCSDRDCHPVDCAEVRKDPSGWLWRGVHFDDRVRDAAPDGACHVCISAAGYGRCIFLGGAS